VARVVVEAADGQHRVGLGVVVPPRRRDQPEVHAEGFDLAAERVAAELRRQVRLVAEKEHVFTTTTPAGVAGDCLRLGPKRDEMRVADPAQLLAVLDDVTRGVEMARGPVGEDAD
jgi:hypothetical protein